MRKPTNRPNIILINCDDLGYGDLGCYGSSVNDTPHLNRMSREGLLFTDFYMASAVCSPSRAAMLTGCCPPRIGFGQFTAKKEDVLYPGDEEGLNPEELTIAGQLKNAGYRTKIVGKWHCGDQPEFLPLNYGFDEYYGLPYSNDMGRQVDSPDSPPLPLLRNHQVLMEQPDQTGLTEKYAQESIEFIRRGTHQPFFLYLAHMYVHLPLFVPRYFLRKSRNGGYGGAVECIDWVAGVIFDELKRQGIDDHTLVIFTSDNGSRARDEGGSNGPLRGHKGTTWEGGMRVPCIMRWPGVIPGESRSSQLATGMDLLPTITEIIGGRMPEDRLIDGKSIYAMMMNPETSRSPHRCFAYYFKDSLQAVRNHQWKLHVNRDGEVVNELYNLMNDIGETTNVFDRNPAVVEELLRAAEEFREDLGDEATGRKGQNIRPCGRVNNARPLTGYSPDHPYMVALYDLADSKVMSG